MFTSSSYFVHSNKNRLLTVQRNRGIARFPTKWGGQFGVGIAMPSSQKKMIFWNGVFWRILSELVWRLPCRNSLQLWCVHTVTNRFCYQNCLTLYSHLKFPSQVYHSTPMPRTKCIHFNITRTKTSSADLHQYQEHEHPWQKWGPPRGDAPATKWNMLSSEDKILIKTCVNLKDFLSEGKLKKEFRNKNWNGERWKTFRESCIHLVRPNALLEAIGRGHPELQITLPQLKKQLRWSCKLYNSSVECSFIFQFVRNVYKSTKKYGSYSQKLHWLQCIWGHTAI